MKVDFDYNPPTDPLRFVYEDAALVVVDKPAGLLSVPGKLEGRQDCVTARLVASIGAAFLVHRLDCDTSGLIIYAKNKDAQGFLGQEFENRRAKKTYLARVSGVMTADDGRVDLPLGADWPNRPRQMVDQQNGRPAITDYKVLSRGPEETRVGLYPLTGRSHQLRVHMLALGHPILGDPIYGTGPALNHPRMMLHAEHLGLHHPVTKDWISFHAEAPF